VPCQKNVLLEMCSRVLLYVCAVQVQRRKQSESSSRVGRDGEWAICGLDGKHDEGAHMDRTEEARMMSRCSAVAVRSDNSYVKA
jgi:hypothetical protein